MGSVILEFPGRGREPAERHRFAPGRVTLGRAYDNDVIISDPFVAPYQAELYFDPDSGWVWLDREPVNPTRGQREAALTGPQAVESGMTVTLGATPLRLVFPDHAVAPTQRIGRAHGIVDWLDRAWLALPLVLVAWLGQSYLDYLGQVHSEARPARHGMAGLIVAFVSLAWAGYWALLARLGGRRPRFWGHCAVGATAVIALTLVFPVAEYLVFWSNSALSGDIVRYGGAAVVAGGAVFWALTMATRLRPRLAAVCAHGAAALVLLLAVLARLASMPDFRAEPLYSGVLKPPLPWAPSVAAGPTLGEMADTVFADIPAAEEGGASGQDTGSQGVEVGDERP